MQKILKKDLEKLKGYALKPSPDSVLLIFHQGVQGKDAREKFKAFKPVSIDIRETEIPQWIKQRVRVRDIDISDEAVGYLISLVGNDLGLLSAEIEKISFIGQKRINTDDISEIVALEPRHALAAVDAHGPGAGILPVQHVHGHHAQPRRDLWSFVLDYAEKNYSKYFNAPDKWTGEPSLSSLEHYARTQKPAPAK